MASKQKSIGKIATIAWEDAWSDSGYYSLDDISREKPFLNYSTGIVIRDDRSGMTVARERNSQNDKFRAVQHIPRAMIQKVKFHK